MKIKTVNVVIAVIVGLSLFAMIGGAFSLLSDFFLVDDLINYYSSYAELLGDIKWSALTVAFVVIAALTANLTALLSKKQGFNITAAILDLAAFIAAIVLLDVIRRDALFLSQSGYATGVGYFAEMLQVAAPSIVLCAFFTVQIVNGVKCRNVTLTAEQPQSVAEVENEKD